MDSHNSQANTISSYLKRKLSKKLISLLVSCARSCPSGGTPPLGLMPNCFPQTFVFIVARTIALLKLTGLDITFLLKALLEASYEVLLLRMMQCGKSSCHPKVYNKKTWMEDTESQGLLRVLSAVLLTDLMSSLPSF